eukprot:c8623_g1_i1.p1 GENE.c8623_g1_i1~~c8623_g1_i1.p1  ORF type:complete len:325 (+),score=50.73 c8623_g1_i1:104-976(+)
MIHDSQPDYYGKFLATCSSDRSVKIFDLQLRQEIARLERHEGPVWQVAWSHPRFGPVLASCGYDRKVIVWKQLQGSWDVIYQYDAADSVNSVAFAPHEYGLILACASSDGQVTVLTYREDTQAFDTPSTFPAHQTGCNSVSFAPFLRPGTLTGTAEQAGYPLQLATAGCDNLVKLWEYGQQGWERKQDLSHHKDWVRDVAWAPNIGLPVSYIASCSQDRSCVIWRLEADKVTPIELPRFPAPVWRVSWSITGNILAVSSGDNRVTLWKEMADGEWRHISSVSESGVSDAQ